MGVAKTYTKADVIAAIEQANERNLKQWRSVSTISNQEFSQLSGDVGHVFRHVAQTAASGKSTYDCEETCVMVTMQMLNSAKGQEKLKALDTASPSGSHTESDPANRKVVCDITGAWYGCSAANTNPKKIKQAACEIIKLGESTLWIHSSYPTRFTR